MILIATFSGYFLLVLLITWFAYRRTSTMSDYILGGRTLGRWTTALSAGHNYFLFLILHQTSHTQHI